MTPYQTVPTNARGTCSPGASKEAATSPLCGGRRPLSVLLGNHRNPPPSDDAERQFRKLERWALQAAAREVLGSKALNGCCRALIPLKAEKGSSLKPRLGVDILAAKGSFHYGGLMTCGSVWSCPICAGKISERKRVDLSTGMSRHLEQGGSVQLWTFTAPHHLGQSLAFLLDALTDARRRMLNRKPWKRLMASLGVVGTVRGVEVTHSFENGWHVHFHVLAFLSGVYSRASLEVIEDMIFTQWQSACLAASLGEPSRAHGVSVDDGQKAAHYVGKWGLEHEMTKSHVKQGRKGHLTPFDFLREYLGGDPRYGRLFKEYATEFKGKRQLVWSDGLRDRLGLGLEATDEELAERPEENAVKFALLPLNVWVIILRMKKRGEILAVCHQGRDALDQYLFDLMTDSC